MFTSSGRLVVFLSFSTQVPGANNDQRYLTFTIEVMDGVGGAKSLLSVVEQPRIREYVIIAPIQKSIHAPNPSLPVITLNM